MHIKGYKGREYDVEIGDLISDCDGHSGVVKYASPYACLIISDVGTELDIEYSNVSHVSKPETEE